MNDAVHDQTIVSLNKRGEGVAADDRVFPGALPGERAHWEGGASAWLDPSPERIAPICRYFGECGGCAAQHMGASLYAGWKRESLVSALRRAGVEAEVGPLVDAHGAGRRRATFHARFFPHGREDVGFMRARAHEIVNIEDCPLFSPDMASAIEAARTLAGELRNVAKPLDIQVTATLEGLDVDLRGSGPLEAVEVRKLVAAAERLDLARVANHGARVIERRPPQVLFGRARVTLPAGGFLQATIAGEEALAGAAAAAVAGTKRVADLFCGAGAFALRLAEAHDVFAVDSDVDAVAALKRGAGETAALRGVETVARDLFQRPLRAAELERFDAVLFDPPRAGAMAQARELSLSAVPTVVAISCNVESFARDARLLVDGGYGIVSVAPLDQFPLFPPCRDRRGVPASAREKTSRRSIGLSENGHAGFVEALAGIVGSAHVLTDPDLIAGNLSEPRGLWHGRALALVRPGTTAEVAAVVAACAAAGVTIVPQGGNTGLVGGQTPDMSGEQIILSLRRLNKIREIDPLTDTMIVEAGVTLAQAQAAAGRRRPAVSALARFEGTCTIGGNLATNAGGVAVLAYGNARDMATGLEVVLADGRVVNALSKLRKDNTGYDLKDLFIGAEGTLGVITAAALKLFPNPRSRVTAFVGLKSPEQALALFRLARAGLGTGVVSFELLPRIAMDFVLKHGADLRDPLDAHHDWYVLMEAASQAAEGLEDALTAMLAGAAEEELIEDAVIAATGEQRAALWRLRETLPDVQGREGGSIKHDVSVPLGVVPAFLTEATAAVEKYMPGARVVAFGHMGDGNIHFNVSQPIEANKEEFLALWEPMNEVVHAIVARYSGSFSAEHGIGQLKRHLLSEAKDPVALDVMRKLKAALDPAGILNPGKVL